MSDVSDRVLAIVTRHSRVPLVRLSCRVAIDQGLKIQGDDAEELVDDLAAAFGDWLYEWPWQKFIDFNEPPANWGPKIWKVLRLPNPSTAFPGYTERRLELGHIVAVIENDQWFDP